MNTAPASRTDGERIEFVDLSAQRLRLGDRAESYGDGGALFTDDADLAGRLRSLRSHGEGSHRYEHVAVGINGVSTRFRQQCSSRS